MDYSHIENVIKALEVLSIDDNSMKSLASITKKCVSISKELRLWIRPLYELWKLIKSHPEFSTNWFKSASSMSSCNDDTDLPSDKQTATEMFNNQGKYFCSSDIDEEFFQSVYLVCLKVSRCETNDCIRDLCDSFTKQQLLFCEEFDRQVTNPTSIDVLMSELLKDGTFMMLKRSWINWDPTTIVRTKFQIQRSLNLTKTNDDSLEREDHTEEISSGFSF